MLGNIKRTFAINLNDYENIGFSLEINKVIFGACIALIIGVVLLSIQRGSTRLMIMQLTRHGATSEDKAKTLSELGLSDNKILKILLRGHNVLVNTVARVGAVKYDYEAYVAMDKEARKQAEVIDFESAKFYIKEEESDRAAFIVERYTVSLTRTVLSCVLVAIISGCVIACMPSVLSLINGFIG